MTPATQNLNAKLSPRTRTARRTRAAMPATSAPGSAAGVALDSSSAVRINGAAARYRGGGYRVNV